MYVLTRILCRCSNVLAKPQSKINLVSVWNSMPADVSEIVQLSPDVGALEGLFKIVGLWHGSLPTFLTSIVRAVGLVLTSSWLAILLVGHLTSVAGRDPPL